MAKCALTVAEEQFRIDNVRSYCPAKRSVGNAPNANQTRKYVFASGEKLLLSAKISRGSVIQTLVPADRTPDSPPTACSCSARRGNWLTTVPREFVHRAAVAEVFLTGWSRSDDAHYSVSAQWPRGHSFFTPVSGSHYDPMLAAETIRQVGALLAHAAFDVPLGHHFLMWGLHYSVSPARLVIGDAPATLDLDVTCTEVRKRGTQLTELRYEVVIRHSDQTIATGGAGYTCTSPTVYRRLRARQLSGQPAPLRQSPPVPPARVGRLSEFDVVLSPSGQRQSWQLRVNTRHPVLFDHPGDHIPGMVLLEAARQASVALAPKHTGVLPVSVDCTFHRYAEFGSPCWIEAEPGLSDSPASEGILRVTGHQDGETVFTATVTTSGV
ncbi:hypothetical protein NLX86_33490 [Streptomyces sp. A3M-1-3]|uniref:ScbA/BarX family gamma-butyrolactone biosynthesis protein n=1 Tax=Streptomyces sp. A3M-1-3 TaxID=2962044 RepID=UPI0020B7958F|nr:ScbA/BarX family gamma-butyrolactone biosynthesis protein [Streptomyces sp. A3M-1-3]MCP3822818.1 hypothetical protein [Streptomyces sp. A3M-1-3]